MLAATGLPQQQKTVTDGKSAIVQTNVHDGAKTFEVLTGDVVILGIDVDIQRVIGGYPNKTELETFLGKGK